MPVVDVVVSCPVFESFRVQQVAGLFDVPLAEKLGERFAVDVPELDADWRVGLIVGPSGSGKTTIARRMFGPSLAERRPWADDRAVVDGLGERPLEEIVGLLSAVGFGSPPGWVKPYQALSNGEQFRCDLARALAEVDQADGDGEGRVEGEPATVAFDEFTSVVDRNVARAASVAVSRAVRRGLVRGRFVAVTCHYDVEEWLAPDWTIDMARREFSGRRLRRPNVELEVFRAEPAAWRLFARHHYLSGGLSPLARCYLATWGEEPVGFCATLNQVGQRGWRRISRLVTLPDYQGLGIGMRLAEAVGEIERQAGGRFSITASHPAVVGHCRRSPRWRAGGVRKAGGATTTNYRNYRGGAGRMMASFEYLGAERPSAR